MKHVLFCMMMTFCTACPLVVRAALEAQPVNPAQALASSPDVSTDMVFANFVADFRDQFIAKGSVGGQVIFQDDFSDATRVRKLWRFVHHVELKQDGRGGTCIHLAPVKPGWSQIILFPQHYIPIDPTHQIMVFWEARSPQGGNPPRIRIDFYDQDKKRICADQMRSTIDPTQPTLFARNAFHVNQWMPKTAAFMRLEFHICPVHMDTFPGEIAQVTAVDLNQDIQRKIAAISNQKNFARLRDAKVLDALPEAWKKYLRNHQQAVADVLNSTNLVQAIANGSLQKASRMHDLMTVSQKGVAPSRILAYTDNNLCSTFPLHPGRYDLPGLPGDALRIRDCPGEMTRGTVILWSPDEVKDVSVHFSPLRHSSGAMLPATVLSAKVVKPWYQGDGSPSSFVALGKTQLLMPELLLHDDSLVIPNHATRENLVKYQRNGKSWYVNINKIYGKTWAQMIPADVMPIRDSSRLLPFTLRANENKQLALRVDIPSDASRGLYRGSIAFKQGQDVLATVPVELTVLPFDLPRKPETIYSPTREFTMGLYYWGVLAPDGKRYISVHRKSREQCLNEIKMMLDNGITNPIMIWGNGIVFNDSIFRQYLQLVKEAGMKDNLYLGAGNLGNPTQPLALKDLQEKLKRAMSIARDYGFKQIYFYGMDEARGKQLVSQIPAWKAAREVGAKVIVSGYADHLRLVGKYLDICVYADEVSTAQPEPWHKLGGRLWKYNTPQAGCEDPTIYRRNYGLDLWRRGFDGASTYCFIGYSSCWNDIASFLQWPKASNHYRSLSLVYPTVDGAIETLAITGLHDAIKDVRYLSLLRQMLRKKPHEKAEQWLRSLNVNGDLTALREEAIDWILKLQE